MRKSVLIQSEFSEKWQNADFEFCGVNWWPLIRCQVSFQTELLNLHPLEELSYESFYSKKLPATKVGIKARLLYFKNRLKPVLKKYRVAVFTVDANKSVPYKNEMINPYTFPFILEFIKSRISFKVFQFYSNDGYDYNNEIILRLYRKRVIDSFNKDIQFQSNLFSFTEDLKKSISPDFDLYNLLVNVIVESQVKYLSTLILLKKYKFKRVLLYCYYDSSTMAFCRAANKLKIPVIEYQHSQISSKHFAYSGWGKSITNSSSFFPSHIWTWRDSDVVNLKKEFEYIPNLKIFKGGNVVIPLFDQISNKNHNNSKLKILVALEGTSLPEYIIDYISVNEQFEWLLRLHPRYPLEKKLITDLKYKNPLSVDIEEANSQSLYELLNDVNYLITSGSGCAIEAQAFDVTNIIFGEKGYTTYKDQIENGLYLFIKNEKDLNEILRSESKLKSNFDPVLIDEKSIKENIQTIFK